MQLSSTAVISLTSALLALIFVFLSLAVIARRRKAKIAFKDGQDVILLRRIRAQANFAEYVPIALILLILSAALQLSPWILAINGVVLLLGRIIHAIGILNEKKRNQLIGRIIGMLMTLVPIIFLAVYLISQSLSIMLSTKEPIQLASNVYSMTL